MRKVVTRKKSDISRVENAKRPKIGEWTIPKKTVPAKQPTASLPLPTGNKFSGLTTVSLGGTPSKRIPPIIMAATTHQTVVDTVKSFGVQDFNLRYTGKQNVAIFAKSLEDHNKIKQGLAAKNKEFHSYTAAEDRVSRSVIKGLPAQMEESDIKEDLRKQGLPVSKVIPMKTTRPLYVITYESAPKTELIKMIRFVCLVKVSIQKFRTKGKITQCFRCQEFGHAAKNCNRKNKCVKCTGEHDSRDCEKKDRSSPAACSGCGGDHPANFKDCPKRIEYVQLLEKKKAAIRTRTRPQNPWTRGTDARIFNLEEDFPSLPNTHSLPKASPPKASLPRPPRQEGDLISTAELYKMLQILQEVRAQASRCSNKMEIALLLVSRLDDFE
jgi:hypothetical protein